MSTNTKKHTARAASSAQSTNGSSAADSIAHGISQRPRGAAGMLERIEAAGESVSPATKTLLERAYHQLMYAMSFADCVRFALRDDHASERYVLMELDRRLSDIAEAIELAAAGHPEHARLWQTPVTEELLEHAKGEIDD